MAKAYSSGFDPQYREVAYDAFLCGYGAKCDAPSSKEHVCLDDGGAPNSQKCGDCTIACGAKVEDDRDVIFWKGMQHAIAEMKEDAVNGIYTKSMDGKNVFVESGALKIDPASVKVGDSVKLIIIKDDGKSD